MSSDRKRVLFLVPAFFGGIGGPERVLTTLLRHIDHSKFECHLALVRSGTEFLEDVPPCVTVHHLRVSRMRYSLPAIITLARRLRPETILSTVMYLNVMLMLAKPFLRGCPKLLLREAVLPSAFLAHEARYPRLSRFLYRRLYPKSDRIICLFDAMVDDVAEHLGISRDRLVRIYNPIDVARVRASASGEASPYAGTGPHVVAVGRLQHQKAYDVLLRAWPQVLRAIPGARLSILGEGPLEAELRALAAALNVDRAIDFRGFHPNPFPYIQHADLFVLASRFEGMPNVVLEALALETPVVATDSPGGIREISRSGAPITLVASESPEALACGIISVLKDKKEDSVAAGVTYLKEFDVERVAAEYSRLL